MKQKIALLLAGVLAGGLLMVLVPAAAHHQPAFKKLKSRVGKLENKVNTLNKKTQYMDTAGFYNASIISEQVIALCGVGTQATWEDTGQVFNETPIVMIDDCFVSGTARSAKRELLRQTGR